MKSLNYQKKWQKLAWLFLLGVIFLVYSPGLSGGFIFDDYPNILEDENIILKEISWGEVSRVSQTGTAGPLKRPVAVVSFALNMFFTGMNPWFFKLTNIIIHLLNTLVLGFLIHQLLQVWHRRYSYKKVSNYSQNAFGWVGWLTAAIWALHPFNLTSVLYIVQRMTSLSTFFGLAAMAFFIQIRNETAWADKVRVQSWNLVFKLVLIILLMLLSVFSKENGLLFLGLMVLVEFFVFRFEVFGKIKYIWNRSLYFWASYGVVVVVASVILWNISFITNPERIYFRDFSTPERLMTEARILVIYLRDIFMPNISVMSLYHDDIDISRSLLNPVSTIFSIFFLVIVSVFCVCIIKAFPIALFAWLWFLISHSMESTWLPLELMHEHRNYFAIIGFCMAISIGLVTAVRKFGNKLWIAVLGILFVLGSSTFVRSYEWKEPMTMSKMEALRHPKSMRANYQLGRDLLVAFDNGLKDDRVLDEATIAFEQAAKANFPSVGPYFGLLFVEFRRKNGDEEHVNSLVKKITETLRTKTTEASYPGYIDSLLKCQLASQCRVNDMDMLAIMVAAIENKSVFPVQKGEILKMAAQYAVSRGNDWGYAQELAEMAIQQSDSAATRIFYAQILKNRDKRVAAAEQIEIAEKLDDAKIYRELLNRERVILNPDISQ
ncbi:hypothetical protein [Comamonas sp.]|uniref:hypothetical protein n=1 Tax=Comamonas sp. TaxID=34028 RepID=UPI00289F8081|nr:hypothetical protein [Comamonas sp.]